MTRKPFAVLLAGAALLFAACKSEPKQEVKKEGSLGDLVKAVENIGKEQEKSADRWAERRAKGDTLAIPYKELQNYLPEIPGYTKDGGPGGEQSAMAGFGQLSTARQEYSAGDKHIEVEIVDYNAAMAGFKMAMLPFTMGFSMEDDKTKQGSVNLGISGIVAFETLSKEGKDAELVVIAGDRFFIKLDGTKMENSEALQSIAKNMKLAELAAK
jgi:hypothetical protein